MASKLIITKGSLRHVRVTPQKTFIGIEELKQILGSNQILKHLFRYSDAEVWICRLEAETSPFITALLPRLMSRGEVLFRDDEDKVLQISWGRLFRWGARFLQDISQRGRILSAIEQQISDFPPRPKTPSLDLTRSPLYLRTDMVFGVRSGGSVGHIAGVLNNLGEFAGKPVFVTTDTMPTVREDIATNLIPLPERYWDFPEFINFYMNSVIDATIQVALGGQPIAFVYQRYGIGNFSGLQAARRFDAPFVLEFNGSEVWAYRNWGKPLKNEALALKIEELNLRHADLIVVVSQPIQEQLLAMGIPIERVLVNPNAVNPDVYYPDIDGTPVREQYGLQNKTVLGFIGTFGAWHGAEVLAEAFGKLMTQYPEYKENVRLLMIGDGMKMLEVKHNLARYEVPDYAVLTGMVHQSKGAAHLAACDILVSPHVPNADGSTFFGSPTKLFEYMAMGRGIVASDLDQIGEVLDHEQTAWMVRPGDADDLMQGMKKLIDHPQFARKLGEAARQRVVERHTWRAHTKNIIEKLKVIAST